jgi:hypothetical protein
MKIDNNQTWISIQSTNTSFIKQADETDNSIRVLNRVTKALFDYLSEFLWEYCKEATLTLTMQEAESDPRLLRSMNDDGSIAYDYGKDYEGRYFKHIEFAFIPLDGIKKDKQEFLIPYFHKLITRYFATHPTAYSNWEFNKEYDTKDRWPKWDTYAPRIVNFPEVIIKRKV